MVESVAGGCKGREADSTAGSVPYVAFMRGAEVPSRGLMRIGATTGAETGRRPGTTQETDMLDIVFLALGLGAFALFGVYAALLRRL